MYKKHLLGGAQNLKIVGGKKSNEQQAKTQHLLPNSKQSTTMSSLKSVDMNIGKYSFYIHSILVDNSSTAKLLYLLSN
jgi:hypothetical protein